MNVLTSSDQAEPAIDLPLDIGADANAKVRKTHLPRLENGFVQKYQHGAVVLDIGYRGSKPEGKTIVPHAIGVDLEYRDYDGHRLPFGDGPVDCMSSSHCPQHI